MKLSNCKITKNKRASSSSPQALFMDTTELLLFSQRQTKHFPLNGIEIHLFLTTVLAGANVFYLFSQGGIVRLMVNICKFISSNICIISEFECLASDSSPVCLTECVCTAPIFHKAIQSVLWKNLKSKNSWPYAAAEHFHEHLYMFIE